METTRGSVRTQDRGLSNAERDACMHALGELHAAGHLTFDALDTRIRAALAAKTEEELAALLSDLPDTTTDAWSPFGGEAEAATETRSEPTTTRTTAPTAPPTAAPRAARSASPRVAEIAATLGAALVAVANALLAATRKVAAWIWALLCAVGGGALKALKAIAAARPRPAPAQPAQDLVAAPRPQAPMQWEPIKVYAVRVPMDPEPVASELPAPTVRELPTAERPALMPGRTGPERELAASERAEGDPDPAEDGAARGVVGQLRPFLDRVTQRAHGRRSGTFPRQRESHEAAERTGRS